MKKKSIVIGIVSLLAILAVGVSAFFIWGTGNGEPDGEPTAQPTPELTDEAPVPDPTSTPEPIDTGDPEFPTSVDYWNGESQPGLCSDMQEWYLDGVQSLTYGEAGFGTLEEELVPAAEEAYTIIDDSDADAETKEIFTNLANSVENYGKYVGDPAAPQQQVLQAVSDQMTASETAKAHCGW